MDELNPVSRVLAQHLADSSRDALVFGLVFAALGLALGIGSVVTARHRGWLRREPRTWAWIARLHYGYVPLLLMAFGGAMGSVYGAHRGVGRAIDQASEQSVAYARGYLPALQAALNARMERARASGVTVDELIAEEMRSERIRNPLARRAMLRLNRVIVEHALNQAQERGNVREPMEALRRLDLTRLDTHAFTLLPQTLHGTANSYFASQYLFVLLLFAPFLLVPPAEFGAYAWWRQRARRVPAS